MAQRMHQKQYLEGLKARKTSIDERHQFITLRNPENPKQINKNNLKPDVF